jgi:hypothetical protein
MLSQWILVDVGVDMFTSKNRPISSLNPQYLLLIPLGSFFSFHLP